MDAFDVDTAVTDEDLLKAIMDEMSRCLPRIEKLRARGFEVCAFLHEDYYTEMGRPTRTKFTITATKKLEIK